MHRFRGVVVAMLAATAACTGSAADDGRSSARAPIVDAAATGTTSTSVAAAPTTTVVIADTSAPAPSAPAPAPAAAPVAPVPPPVQRSVHVQEWTPFATAGALVLRHPAARVERVGFHESNHDGAQPLDIAPTAAAPVTLESRDRGTGTRTAADIVVDPEVEIRAPVTGRVLRAGTYVLYCKHSDDFAVIEPDARPGWEVKVLHIDGVAVRPGDRVEAGRTLLARRATVLPFASQVDEHTAEPSWPHVHLEVVDPSVKDRPSGRGC